MNKGLIDRFLKTLAAELDVPARAYLTGAAAAALWGRVRPSLDIDFGLQLRGGRGRRWDEVVDPAVRRTTDLTGVPVSVAEDIDHWGMITLLDYKRSSRLYRRFGKLEVRLLDPINWSIGKLTRALEPDLRDVREVFRKQQVAPARTAATWGRALRASPPSASQWQFRGQVEAFFRTEGRRIWGRAFDPELAIRRFERAAGLRQPPRRRR